MVQRPSMRMDMLTLAYPEMGSGELDTGLVPTRGDIVGYVDFPAL